MNNIKITIVPFRDEYADDLSKLICRNFFMVNIKDYPKSEMLALSVRHKPECIIAFSKQRHMLVALYDGKPVGTVSTEPDQEDCNLYHIYTMFVDPDWQSKGIGKVLMAEIELYARTAGATSLCLYASITAFSFYKKLGFQPIDREQNEHGLYKMIKGL